MTTPGSNSTQPVQSNFNGTFPLVGAAAGMLGTTGTMVPLNSDASGNLLVSGNFTASLGGTTAVNLTQVGNSTFGLGQAVMASSLPVAIASNQSAIPITGSITATNPSVSTTGTTVPADATLIGINIAGNLQAPVGVIATSINATAYVPRFDLSSLGGTALAIGQAPMTASMPVVIASNQSNLSTIIVAALPVGANAIGTVTALQGAAPWSQNLTQVGGTALSLGQAVMATSVPVVFASNQSALTTVVSGTVSVTGTSAFNLAQVGGTAISLGQAVMATSVPVVIASNQSALTAVVSGTVSITGSITAANPSVSTTGTTAPAEATYIGVNVGGTMQAPVAVVATSINATAYVPRLDLSSMGGTALAIGQGVMTASIPVVIASNQSNLTTVIGAALPAGANAIGTVTALQGAGPWSQNLTQVGGSAIALGQTTMATSFPVVIASNQSALTAVVSGTVTANLAAGANAIGTVSATQIGTWAMNITQIAGLGIATGGATGLFTVGGPSATNSAILGWPILFGGRAQTAEISTTTNGSAVMAAFDAVGRQIVALYANKENYVAGATTSAVTSLVQVIGSVNATNRIYITSMQFGNTSGSTVFLTFNDSKTSNFIVPSGGGSNINFPMPLQFTLGSAVTFTTSTAVSTVYVNAQGFSGT